MASDFPFLLLSSPARPSQLPPELVERCLRRFRNTAPSRVSSESQEGTGEEDLALVRRALAGDERATRELLRRIECLPVMVLLRHQRMGSPLPPQELDDVVQNALTALWRKLDRYDGRARLEQWAYGFASVELVKTVERRARRAREQPSGDSPDVAVDPPEELPLDVEKLDAALGRLEGNDARIVRARHYEELGFDEIAERQGRPVNTIKTRYYRSLKRLRIWLGGSGEETIQ